MAVAEPVDMPTSSWTHRLLLGAALALSVPPAACADGDDVEDAEEIGAESSHEIGDGMLRRVVIARMYQRGVWTIPDADHHRPAKYGHNDASSFDPAQRAEYVCEALAYLRPTYVSGLVRFDDGIDEPPPLDQPVDSDQQVADVFRRVKQCVRDRVGHPVKFDVVLNALQYTDPEFGVHTGPQGADKARARLRHLDDLLHPDVWFFDFFAKPWADDGKEHHKQGMEAAIQWIHNHGALVGGNGWGPKVPPGADFMSITDKDGMQKVESLTEAILKKDVPVLMHVRNDPHIHESEGVYFTKRPRSYRRMVVDKEMAGESMGYRYMVPLFFPLKEDSPERPGPKESYNAVEDGTMLKHLCVLLDGGDASRCEAPPVPAGFSSKASTGDGGAPQGEGGDDAAPPPEEDEDAPYFERVGVHRALNGQAQQHLFSASLEELESSPALTVEMMNAFFLQNPAAGDGSVPFYRCYLGSGWHLHTTSPTCEDAPGAINEGAAGHVATSQVEGTVPLYRLFRGAKLDHFYTTSAGERDYAVALGYADEGIAGYVYPEP